MNARLSTGPQSQVSATPRSERPTSGLMRQSSAPVPFMASTMKLVGAPRKRWTSSVGGRSIDTANAIGGGSSIMADLASQIVCGGGIAPLAPADSNARSTRLGNHRKKAGVSAERPFRFRI